MYFVTALYDSDLCLCGQNISILNQQDDTQCDLDCAELNPTSKCGGSNSIAVYRAGTIHETIHFHHIENAGKETGKSM